MYLFAFRVCAQIAQLVEQRTENPRVAGSIPALGIFNAIKYGILAQSVEHLTFNQVVRGSNPRCLIIENGEDVEKSTFSLFLCLRTFINSCVLSYNTSLRTFKVWDAGLRL